jgi:hypothetical protein
MQVSLGVAMVGSRFAAFERERAEWVGVVLAELVQRGCEIFAVPEILRVLGKPLVLDDVEGLDDDHDPRDKRHADQQHRDGLGDEVALVPDVHQAELGIHTKLLQRKISSI